MDESYYPKIAADLPNFPEELIQDWIMRHGPNEWPPTFDKWEEPQGEWRRVLVYGPLDWWRQVQWVREAIPLDSKRPEGWLNVSEADALRYAYEKRMDHPDGFPEGESERVKYHVGFILEHGRMNGAPILFRARGRLEPLDGLHRLAALFHLQATGAIKADAAHDVWITDRPPKPDDW